MPIAPTMINCHVKMVIACVLKISIAAATNNVGAAEEINRTVLRILRILVPSMDFISSHSLILRP